MPLYHSNAGCVGMGQTLLSGVTAVIRKKFSASRFWDEALRHECTVTQYIGEICRYLLAQPPKESERKHKIRMMMGNNLRPSIWKEFVTRFRIEKIGEFYGSTEGNSNICNTDNYPGACGFLPVYAWARKIYPIGLVKVDEDTSEIVRNKDGLCIPCGPGQSGEIIGKIVKGDPIKDFHGYANKEATKKKIICDVYSKGDVAFSSGDILYMNRLGYLFFKDRTGDTFRWKSENVSTAEVEAAIHKIIGLKDATAYGVEIPGTEGKAGMAAITDVGEKLDLEMLADQLKDSLPAYARPIFIRLCKELDFTGTYKFKKTAVQKSGYDPAKCGNDKIFFMNPKTNKYELMTNAFYKEISDGKMRF